MAIAERLVQPDRTNKNAAPSRGVPARDIPTVRARRSTSAGTRSHAASDGSGRSTARAERIAATSPRPMVRATAGIEVDLARPLALVPRRRRAARFAGVACALVVMVMLGVAAFQTQLARRQVQIDQLDQDISSAREQYDQSRRERAELRSPSRLASIAEEQGMVAATDTDFMVMSPDVLAEVQESTGVLADGVGIDADDPLEQFRSVKSVTDGKP